MTGRNTEAPEIVLFGDLSEGYITGIRCQQLDPVDLHRAARRADFANSFVPGQRYRTDGEIAHGGRDGYATITFEPPIPNGTAQFIGSMLAERLGGASIRVDAAGDGVFA